MRIQTTMIRKGGTQVELDGIHYHFAPQDDGRHIANVRSAAHVKRFLAIDGYNLLDEDIDDENDEVEDPKEEDPNGTKTEVLPPDPNPPAGLEPENADEDKITSSMIDDEGTDAGKEDDGDEGENTGEKVAPPKEPAAGIPDDISEPDLDALFVKEVGRAPHPNMKRESKIAKIAEARTQKSGADA